VAVVKSPMEQDALEESTVEIWNLANRRLLSSSTLPIPSGIMDLCFSPDGTTLAVARWRGLELNTLQGANSLHGMREYPLFLLDGKTGNVRDRLTHPKSCYMSQFSPDSKKLVTLSGGEIGERITVWDLESRVPTGKFAVEANAIALSHDGKW